MAQRCSNCSGYFESTPGKPHHFQCRACGTRRLMTVAALPAVQRQPLVIEGEVVRETAGRSRRAAPRVANPGLLPPPNPAQRPRSLRGIALAAAFALVAGVTVPVAAAIPGLFGGEDAVVIERVASTTMVVAGENALVVVGTLANPTARELPVPAVKVALNSGGADAYSWVVEPSALVLAPGGSIGFRSTMKNPVSGAARVVVSLVPREQRIGMR